MKWYMNKREFLGIIAVVFFFVVGGTLAQSITFEEAVRESVKARYAAMPGFTGKVIVNAGEARLIRERTGHPMLAPAALELRESPAGGNFLVLDGVDDYARINSVPELQLNENNNPTIEARVYFNSLPNTVGDITTTLILQKVPAYGLVVFEGQLLNEPRRIVAIGFEHIFQDEFGAGIETNLVEVDIPLKQWVHIAACNDIDSDTVFLAFNGVVEKRKKSKTPRGGADEPLTIGGTHEPVDDERFLDGFIDEVRISNEIRYRDDDFTPPNRPFDVDTNTVALYHFNEPKGATKFKDASGRSGTAFGRNGTKIDSAPDTIPPKYITDLQSTIVTGTARKIKLSWTAPGDDGLKGTATGYDVRFSKNKISDANFDNAEQVSNIPKPTPAGSKVSFEISELKPETLYYFALKTADEVPNWSKLSNVSKIETPRAVNSMGKLVTTWGKIKER